MPAKPRKPGKYDENGLPRDPRDWTEDDWRDLHAAMATVKRLIAGRHAGEIETTCHHCRGTGRTGLSREYAKTFERIKNRAGDFTAAGLAREWDVPATRINNQLAALEKHGLLSSSPNGRERLYQVRANQ